MSRRPPKKSFYFPLSRHALRSDGSGGLYSKAALVLSAWSSGRRRGPPVDLLFERSSLARGLFLSVHQQKSLEDMVVVEDDVDFYDSVNADDGCEGGLGGEDREGRLYQGSSGSVSSIRRVPDAPAVRNQRSQMAASHRATPRDDAPSFSRKPPIRKRKAVRVESPVEFLYKPVNIARTASSAFFNRDGHPLPVEEGLAAFADVYTEDALPDLAALQSLVKRSAGDPMKAQQSLALLGMASIFHINQLLSCYKDDDDRGGFNHSSSVPVFHNREAEPVFSARSVAENKDADLTVALPPLYEAVDLRDALDDFRVPSLANEIGAVGSAFALHVYDKFIDEEYCHMISGAAHSASGFYVIGPAITRKFVRVMELGFEVTLDANGLYKLEKAIRVSTSRRFEMKRAQFNRLHGDKMAAVEQMKIFREERERERREKRLVKTQKGDARQNVGPALNRPNHTKASIANDHHEELK